MLKPHAFAKGSSKELPSVYKTTLILPKLFKEKVLFYTQKNKVIVTGSLDLTCPSQLDTEPSANGVTEGGTEGEELV